MNVKHKSIFNATWKVGLGLFGLVVFVIGILLTTTWYDNTYGRNYRMDKTLSKNIEVLGFRDNSVRVWDWKEDKYVTPKLRWVSGTPQRDSITVYCDVNDRRGYLNCNTGRIVIPAETAAYHHAWQFSEGRAFVVVANQDSLSVIDYSGKIVFRNVAPYIKGYDYVFEDGLCELYVDGKFGLFAKDGTWAVEPKYNQIECPNTFGYRIARDEEGNWLFDPQLNLLFPVPYDQMSYAAGRDEGTGTLYRTRDHVKQLVNYDGSVVEPFVIDGTYNLKYMVRYSEEGENEYVLDPDLVVYHVEGWEGLMDKHTGRVITPAVYTNFRMISKDLIMAELSYSYNDESVVMDRSGRIVRH